MKRISKRIQTKYMGIIVEESRRTHRMIFVLPTNKAFEALRNRDDFDSVLRLLESQHYIIVERDDLNQPYKMILTDLGYCYFENSDAAKNERKWTRSLAIVAILISLLALCLEFFDSKVFDWFFR